MEKLTAKQMAENILKASKDKMERNVKDSVFCDLFSMPEYLLQLYQVFHPEDTETSYVPCITTSDFLQGTG